MKLICVEEHIQSPTLARLSMPAMLEQAPYLTDWGKEIKDKVTDTSRPRVIAAEQSLRKLLEFGEARIAEMQANQIDMQILSYAGLPQAINAKERVGAIRQANDQLAGQIRKFPSCFSGYATLPWEDAAQSVAELERCVKQLGLKAVLINGRPGQDFLDHPRYLPILEKINELNVLLFCIRGLHKHQYSNTTIRDLTMK